MARLVGDAGWWLACWVHTGLHKETTSSTTGTLLRPLGHIGTCTLGKTLTGVTYSLLGIINSEKLSEEISYFHCLSCTKLYFLTDFKKHSGGSNEKLLQF